MRRLAIKESAFSVVWNVQLSNHATEREQHISLRINFHVSELFGWIGLKTSSNPPAVSDHGAS